MLGAALFLVLVMLGVGKAQWFCQLGLYFCGLLLMVTGGQFILVKKPLSNNWERIF